MGLFNHLFKNKSSQGDERMEEGNDPPPLDGAAETSASPEPDPSVFLHPKAYVPRGGGAPVLPGARSAGHAGGKPSERKASHSAPPVAGEIVLTLGDVLSRIPTQLLKGGGYDAKRELRFKIGDLSSDIARGRAVVPLSRIAALCPDIFQKEVTPAEDMDIRLPLQKLVEQIGLMRSNPPSPLPERAPHPPLSEMPPALLPTRVPLSMRTPAPPLRAAALHKGELKPATPGALPPNAFELKPRAASPPLALPEISKALQENILKAQAVPSRRIPAESRHAISPKPEPSGPDGKEGEAFENPSNPAVAESGKVIPFPAIASQTEMGSSKSDAENSEHSAERALEERLRQLLAEKAAGESALKPELTAPSHLVTALAEIALQQAALKTLDAQGHSRKEPREAEEGQPSVLEVFAVKGARAADVSLAQPANLEALEENAVKSQLLSLLWKRLAESGERRPETGENFPVDAELRSMECGVAERCQETMKTAATPESMEASVSESAAAAGIDAEMPRNVIAPREAESKALEISSAEVFQAMIETTVEAEVLKGIVSTNESISPPKTEIVQREAALKETTPRKPEVKTAKVEEAALKELAKPKLPREPASKAGAPAGLPLELPHVETASKETEPKKPEASAAKVFEDTLRMTEATALLQGIDFHPESISLPKAENARAEIAPQETEAKGLPAGTATAFKETPTEVEAPVIDAPAAVSQKEKSGAALFVSPDSLAALTESVPETSTALALPLDEEGGAHGARRICLSLPAILKKCPPEIFAGELPQMRGDLEIELPFAQIEPQLASGAVEISSLRFIAALPPEYMRYFVVRENVKVSLPMEEILRNLPPGFAPPGMQIRDAAQKLEHPAPEPDAATSAFAETSMPPASLEHSSRLTDAAADSPPAEPVAAKESLAAQESVVSEDPLALMERMVKEFRSEEKPAESAPAPAPISEPITSAPESIAPGPLALHIPAFRVFAPPPPQVNASIASEPMSPVPLAWAGHVSTQPPRSSGSHEEETEALHSPAPPEDGAPKREAVAESPSPDLEVSQAPGLARPFKDAAAEAAATPENFPPNANAAKGRDIHSPVIKPPALPVESAERAEQADLSLAAPEAEKEGGSKVDSTPPAEHTALIRPPMIRPMVVPPPRILAFTSTVDSKTVAPLPESSSAVEPSAREGREAPSIPPAFALASEGASSAGSAAENQGDATLPEKKSPVSEAAPPERAPDSPKPEPVTNGAAAVAEGPKTALPQIARKSTGEKAPIPAPPKISLSVPKLPVLHVPPVPKAEVGIPAPEAIAAPPPPLPLVRFDQNALQTLFMTDEFLDLPAVCRHVSALPGIQACVISRRDEKVHAGEMPDGFEFSELLAFAPGVTQAAGRLPIGILKHFTLYAETHSVSFFERHGVYLCVVHRARSFVPGVREKLVTVADELSKS